MGWRKYKKLIIILLGIILPTLVAISVAVGVVFNQSNSNSQTAKQSFSPLKPQQLTNTATVTKYDYANYQKTVNTKTFDELEKDEIIITQLLLQEWKPYLFKMLLKSPEEVEKPSKPVYRFFDVKKTPQTDDILFQIIKKIHKYLWSWFVNRLALFDLAKKEVEQNQNFEPIYRFSTVTFSLMSTDNYLYQRPTSNLLSDLSLRTKQHCNPYISCEDEQILIKAQKLYNIESKEGYSSDIDGKNVVVFGTKLKTFRKEIDDWLAAFYESIPPYNQPVSSLASNQLKNNGSVF